MGLFRNNNKEQALGSSLTETDVRSHLDSQYMKLKELMLQTHKWKQSISIRHPHISVSFRDFDDMGEPNKQHSNGNYSSKPILIRGQAIVQNCTPQEFFAYVDSNEIGVQQQIDPKLLHFDIKKRFHPTDDNEPMIIRVCFKSPSVLVSNRDFVFVRDVRRSGDIHSSDKICNLSTGVKNTQEWPPVSGFTRGFIHYSYWELERVHDVHLKVTYINCVDLSGWIPQAILNILSDDQPLVIGTVAQLLGKKLAPK